MFLACGSALVLTASVAAAFGLSLRLVRSAAPFPLALERLGPPLNAVLMFCALGQGLLFAAQGVRLFRGHGAGWTLCLSAAGFYLPLLYRHGVFLVLSDADALFPALRRITLAVFWIGLAGICLALFLTRLRALSAASAAK